MLKEGKFGYHEAISLIVIITCIRVFFSSPNKVVALVGTTGWLMTLISTLTAALMFTFVYMLLKWFPGKNIMEINDIVLGKVLGAMASLILGGFLIFIGSISMREFIEVIKVYVLPESPPSFLMVIFATCVVTLAFMGLETIARYSKFIIYVLLTGFILVALLSMPNYSVHRLYPLFGYGLDKTLIHGFLRSSFYGQVAIVGVIAQSLHDIKDIKRVAYGGLFISGIFTSVALLLFSLVFPYTIGQELTSPMYQLASLVVIGGFVERMEPIFLFLWNFGSFIEVSVLFYSSLMIYCHVFRISDKRPIILPLATVMYCVNLIPKGITEVLTGLIQTVRSFGWVFYFLPSILVFFVALIRRKKGDSNNA